jgi:Holliday junction resolvase
MGPEAKFYQQIKRNFKEFSLIRLENSSLLGTPDLLVYNNNGHFCTVELKVTKGNSIRFSPHQIAFHTRHNQKYQGVIQFVSAPIKLPSTPPDRDWETN